MTILVLTGQTSDEDVLPQKKMDPIVTDENDCLDTLLETVEYPDSVFHPVFSDASSSESSDE